MFKIRVPATSANVGPGFDVYGLAVNLYNYFTFRESKNFKDDTLVHFAYKEAFKDLGKELIPISIQIESDVPSTRGLGSSSTCIVAGVAAALLKINGHVDKDELLRISSKLEGHPDNVAPAILGSMVASVMVGEKVYPIITRVHEDLNIIALIPDFKMKTEDSRDILPRQYSSEDAIHNISRSALLIPGLENLDEELLKVALDDRMHEPYRKKLIRNFDVVKEKSYEFGGCGFYLSGAGPTMIVLARKDSDVYMKIKGYLGVKEPKWDVMKLEVDTEGARLL